MGFRTGAYCTIFEVKPVSDTATDLRISISRKKEDEYIQDFGGYVRCYGTAAASKAASLHIKDRIKLGDVDVSNNYVKETKTTYTNYKVFSFEVVDSSSKTSVKQGTGFEPQPIVDDGEPDDSGLPF